jgi:hypothetical protein
MTVRARRGVDRSSGGEVPVTLGGTETGEQRESCWPKVLRRGGGIVAPECGR